MRRVILMGVLAMAISTVSPAIAQQDLDEPRISMPDASLVGLRIVSSDGQEVGQVTEVGIDDGQAILVGEIDRPLGIGSDAVAIPAEMFVNRGDHVELTITTTQIRDRVGWPVFQDSETRNGQ